VGGDELERRLGREQLALAAGDAGAGVRVGEDAAEVRGKLLEMAEARSPTFAPARIARARDLLSALARNASPCAADERSNCIARIRDEAETIRKLDEASCEPLLLIAEAEVVEGEYAKVEQQLARDCGSCSEKTSCLGLRLSAASHLPSTGPLMVAGRDYLAVMCSNDGLCVRGHMTVGDLFAARGLWTIAVDHYQEAASKSRNAEWWLRTADASLHAGQMRRASLALLRARRDGAGDSALESRINELQTQLGEREAGK